MLKNDELMLLLSQGLEMPEINAMIKSAKRKFVNERHSRKISPMTNSSGYKKGRWKTYIYVDGKRKEVAGKTKDDVYEALFEHYSSLEKGPKTLADVFDALRSHKKDERARSSNTISEDVRMFNYLSNTLKEKAIVEITDSDIQKWIVKEFLPKKPTETALKKQLQLLGQVFDFGIRKKICFDNPMKYISSGDYIHRCNTEKKCDEEKAFSKEELDIIRSDCQEHLTEPFSLMTLTSSYSGLRAGELPALHKSDDLGDFLHIHRQQIREKDDKGHQFFYEVPYTKDERLHPHNGRFVPITPELRKILNHAKNLPGESEYIFHDSKGNILQKDSYEQNLRRRCSRLGIDTSNNHAFRTAFNSKLIKLGFSPAERALILGHEVQTNEKNYSVTDKRELNSLRERLVESNNADDLMNENKKDTPENSSFSHSGRIIYAQERFAPTLHSFAPT